MSVNPYESPRAVSDENRSRKAVAPGRRVHRSVPVPPLISVLVVAVAGIVGSSLFFAIIEGMYFLGDRSNAFNTALPVGIVGAFSVLMAADWRLQRQPPAFFLAVIGTLLATPPGLAIAFSLGLMTYDMGAKNVSGAAVLGVLTYSSFFFMLSLGGWLAIRLRRRVALS